MIVPSDTKKMNTIDKLGIGYRSTNIHTIIYAQIYTHTHTRCEEKFPLPNI